MKTLSERIAAHISATSSATQGAKNRAAFITQRSEIQKAIDDGYSMLAIWQALHEEQVITFSYQAFRRYVNSLITGQANNFPAHQASIDLRNTSFKKHPITGGYGEQ
jgi:hypothetical protein